MSKPSKAHTVVVEHLLPYLTETTDFTIAYKQGGPKFKSFSDSNCGTTWITGVGDYNGPLRPNGGSAIFEFSSSSERTTKRVI